MTGIQSCDFFDLAFFVIEKNLHVEFSQEVQINLEAIVSNSHNKIPVGIQGIDFSIK